MSSKSTVLSRSAAAQIEQRKHHRTYLYEDEEPESRKKEPQNDEANQWLLGPEQQLRNS
jgi:hypothetical protein